MNRDDARLPFAYDLKQPFIEQLGEWVGEVFYETLPAEGFELRDEQIYMAYQLERAFAGKKTIFAEAGVGTGKTLVYLLYAVCYARYKRKPAIIACADESLIEQLVKEEGDIAKLAKHLGLNVDVRLAKSPDKYLCLRKLDEARMSGEGSLRLEELYDGLPDFVNNKKTLQAFYPYGDRKQYADLDDETWGKVTWDPFQDCMACEKRHRCGQTLSREHYRKAADLIVCSHDFYTEHLWTAEARKREGQLPLLPEASSIVFDEGHLLETAAQHAFSYKLRHSVLEGYLTRLLVNGVREELALAIEEVIMASDGFFAELSSRTRTVEGSVRKEIMMSEELLVLAWRLNDRLVQLEEEITLESGTYVIDEYRMRIVEEHIEMLEYSLQLFQGKHGLIAWVTEVEGEPTLSVMPRLVKDLMKEYVFSKPMPVIFSSATQSVDGSFEYLADSLGVEDYLSFSVSSPFDYSTQMKVSIPEIRADHAFEDKFVKTMEYLDASGGRALLLFRSSEDLLRVKARFQQLPQERRPWTVWFEGDREISGLIRDFQREETSVLCAVTLWEGLDIPGPSLSTVIVWSLPFPPDDPVFAAKRKVAADPMEEVDLPYMLLRLRQGLGRLIRTRTDRGTVVILNEDLAPGSGLLRRVIDVIPEGTAVEGEESVIH